MQAFEIARETPAPPAPRKASVAERVKQKPLRYVLLGLLCVSLAGLVGFLLTREGDVQDSKAGSCVPGHVNGYAGIIRKEQGSWCLNSVCGDYHFDPKSGWLSSQHQVGQFSCQRLQDKELNLEADEVWKLRNYFHILSSDITAEIQKEENAGALFVVPSQLNGAEYPSDTRVVHHVEDYKSYAHHSGPRAQLAAHPAAAQFLLDNAATEKNPKGINAIDAIAEIEGFGAVNGFMKIDPSKKRAKRLEELKKRLHRLRLLVMEHVSTGGLVPKLSAFANGSHRVGLVYASAVPVNASVNAQDPLDPQDYEDQTKVAELLLTAQYYGALKYAAESTQNAVELTPRHKPRKVFFMPVGAGSSQNPWDTIGKSMAMAIQMLDHNLHVTLEISALTFHANPSEEQNLRATLEKLHSKVEIDERCTQPDANHASMMGAFRPVCRQDGSFAPQQCWASTGFCWCSDKAGHEFRGSRGRPGPRPEDCEQLRLLKDAGNNTDCHLQLLKGKLAALIGAPEPTCLPEGGYAARQCWGSVDECWCSDGTGKELEGTRGKPGPSLEDCAAKLGGSPDCPRCTVRHQQQGVNCVLGYCISASVKTH